MEDIVINNSQIDQILCAVGVSSFNTRTGAVTLVLDDVSAVVDTRYVLKAGDTMTGALNIDMGAQAVGPGTALNLKAVFDDSGLWTENFSLLTLHAPSVDYATAHLLTALSAGGQVVTAIEAIDGALVSNSTVRVNAIGVYPDPFNHLGVSFNANPASVGFWGATAPQQASGADLTNNVAVGGTDNVVEDLTSLDAATIRNNFYQLARKLKQINDGLRAYGLFN